MTCCSWQTNSTLTLKQSALVNYFYICYYYYYNSFFLCYQVTCFRYNRLHMLLFLLHLIFFVLPGDVLQVLSSAMSLLRRCRVNAALTIQLFSQLFHYINMWLFNKLVMEPRRQLCTRDWGHRLKRRLDRVEVWAEKQGLELAADCHLARIVQVSVIPATHKTLTRC